MPNVQTNIKAHDLSIHSTIEEWDAPKTMPFEYCGILLISVSVTHLAKVAPSLIVVSVLENLLYSFNVTSN